MASNGVRVQCIGGILASLIREYSLHNVVEVGCGLGKITNMLNEACADAVITGVDVSETAINKAQRSNWMSSIT